MDPLIVVTHPDPIELELRPLPHGQTPEGAVALGYYHQGHLIARGVVAATAVEAIQSLLEQPVSIALAASEDEAGNIEARVCLVLPLDAELIEGATDEVEQREAWRASVPELPAGIEDTVSAGEGSGRARLALLPIGNVVRAHKDRHFPDDAAADAREMLDNLVGGRAQDAIRKAIDDLLNSL